MNTRFIIAFLVLAFTVGCSSSTTKNIASEASQEEIDNYNQMIQREAEQAKQSFDNAKI
ncbi:hypothetical protein SH528x_000218 [Novipirellula sp. SH528]|uniref:hypothetical protein n=1 Tax=Novipirellula sp. SH528 TaxID=3454466 RepID=UPI003FA0146B